MYVGRLLRVRVKRLLFVFAPTYRDLTDGLLAILHPNKSRGKSLGRVRSKPGADIICSWYLLCANINRRRFSLSDAGEQISFELSAYLGENMTVHSKCLGSVVKDAFYV